MDPDVQALTVLNDRFVEAFRRGSWEHLQPVLSPSFRYLDGGTGELWPTERYVDDLRANAAPTLATDQLAVHVSGDVAVVSARSTTGDGRFNRYVAVYQRSEGGWTCHSACVWPLA